MIRTILVPVDGSPLSERALIFAEAFARRTRADVIMLEVVSPGKPAEPESAELPETGTPPHGTVPSRAEGTGPGERAGAQPSLEDLRARRPGLSDATLIVRAGNPAEQILRVIEERQIDLVVMSTHGRSGLGRWIYGSVADAVMRQSPVPVLLVSPSCRLTWPDDRSPQVLVPLDGSAVSERALQPAADLADALEGTIVLLQVVEPHPMAYAEASSWAMLDPTASLDAARDYLDDVAGLLRAGGRPVKVVVGFGFTLSWLDRIVREEDIELIVMSSHGSSGIKRAILGSVATGAIQYATVPIVIVGPAMAPRGRATSIGGQPIPGSILTSTLRH